MAAILMTLSDLEDILLSQAFSNRIFIELCNSWQDLKWHRASCSPSAI